jgi:hypothetical protein
VVEAVVLGKQGIHAKCHSIIIQSQSHMEVWTLLIQPQGKEDSVFRLSLVCESLVKGCVLLFSAMCQHTEWVIAVWKQLSDSDVGVAKRP